MGFLQLLARRFQRRFRGKTFCTIENRSTHEFEVTKRYGFMLILKCQKCDVKATYDPLTGLHI
jgi:hypothetical protein